MGKRGWIIAAGLAGAAATGLIVGRNALPSTQPISGTSPTAAATAIPITPRAMPTPGASISPVLAPRPTPRPVPVRHAPLPRPSRAAPPDPDPVTVTTTNSW